MAEITKRISADDRLKFIALMTMAAEHVRETRKIEQTIQRLISGEDGDHVSDAIYGLYEPPTKIVELDDILLKMGIGVNE